MARHVKEITIRGTGLLISLMALGLVCLSGCASHRAAPAAQPASAGGEYADRGRQVFSAGQFESAAAAWQRAAELDQANHQPGPRADALINLATADEMLGQYDQAKAHLAEAAAIATSLGDARREFSALNTLGAVCTLKPDPEPAAASSGGGHVHGGAGSFRDPEVTLERALRLATDAGDADAQASAHDNLGNLLTDRKRFDEALGHYERCASLAETAGDAARMARGQANAGACALTAAEAADADANRAHRSTRQAIRDTEDEKRQHAGELRRQAAGWDEKAYKSVSSLPATHVKAMLLNLVGQTDQRIARDVMAAPSSADAPPTSPAPAALLDRARRACSQAIDVAGAIDDQRSLSYACGYLGHLDEMAAFADVNQPQRHAEEIDAALALTRRAVFSAQQAQCGESLYRWEWQAGRLLTARGDLAGAIEACRRAVQSVKNVRGDIALGNGNQRARANFREDVGNLYFDLADLLLRQIDTDQNSRGATPPRTIIALTQETAGALPRGYSPLATRELQAQRILLEARETVESLKSAEWEDYLRDECVPTFHSEQEGIQKIEGTTAVVYIIPLSDRIELLVQYGDHLRRYVTPIGAAELSGVTGQFRELLPYIATDEYREPGQKLYHWLIDPIRADLTEAKVDTLIFVPDGVLRTIPMAALVDGASGDFLIDQYAIGVVPSLGLTAEGPGRPVHGGSGAAPEYPMLVNGLSTAVGAFPALPFVSTEVRNVKGSFPDRQVDMLVDDRFVVSNLQREFSEEQPGVVHIASHGQFGSEAKDTFILTYEESNPLTLNQLERLVKVNNYKGRRPVGLLVLSACQTAAGDDRAALGLGGIAVKSGARSAVATLWSVNDESSTQIISGFYRQLHDHPETSMSMSLRAAQLEMIHHPNKLAYQHPYFWAPYLMIGNWR